MLVFDTQEPWDPGKLGMLEELKEKSDLAHNAYTDLHAACCRSPQSTAGKEYPKGWNFLRSFTRDKSLVEELTKDLNRCLGKIIVTADAVNLLHAELQKRHGF